MDGDNLNMVVLWRAVIASYVQIRTITLGYNFTQW